MRSLSRRSFLGGCMCCAAAPGLQASAQSAPQFTFESIASGVYRHVSWSTLANGTWFPSNGMVIVGAKRALMADTAWTNEQTGMLLTKMAPITKARPIDLFITHFHADRMGGIETTAMYGIASQAFAGTVEQPTLHASGRIDKTVAGDAATFDLGGGRIVDVFYPGPAHTVDNSVVYDRRTKTLFGGCMMRAVSTTDLGNTADADVAQWAGSVGRVAARFGDVERIVPGHGAVGDAGIFAHTIKLAKG